MAPRRRGRGPAEPPSLHLTPVTAERREPATRVTAGGDGTATARRDLLAWGAAVAHLHALGLPAAVPEFPAAWLARRGVRADWTVAA
jgi:hypothetical protein